MKSILLRIALVAGLIVSGASHADKLSRQVQKDYDAYLGELFVHFHENPELSMMEDKTAARMAKELRAAGFEVTEGVGGTGVIAMMENGPGPLVMMRADMDGLPVEEKSGLPYASRAQQLDWHGNEVFVMHACGHDVHITSLVGTARIMANSRDTWSGTLMLLVQPAEERIVGAKAMMEDDLWKRFGRPDYAVAFHVDADLATGKIVAREGAAYSGADTVDIYVPGVGAHGASPHQGIDPIVLGSQIVLALQTVVTRDLAPQQPGIITVGAFHSGTKHNIISDQAHLQLTVRNDNLESRKVLLDGIKRVATNMGRVAGLPEDNLPRVVVSDEGVPPTVNDLPLTKRLRAVWVKAFGADVLNDDPRTDMGAEDFPYFTIDPYIPSTYFAVGGTPQADFDRAKAGGAPVGGHHSPLFKIDPEPAVTLGTEATIVALRTLLQKQ